MKIRYQLLLLMIFLSLSFFALGSLAFFQDTLLLFVLTTISFYLLTAVLLYIFFIKRVERLNKNLGDVQSGTSEKLTTNLMSRDEFFEITSRINVLFETIKLSRQQLSFQAYHKSNIELSNVNKFNLDNSHEDSIKLQDRMHFNEALSKILSYVKRHHTLAAILLMDIDFRSDAMMSKADLNNVVLIELAKKFSNVLRNEDLIAKLDGNEFVVLLNDIKKPKFASAVAEKLLEVIVSGVHIDNKALLLRVSIGVCICPLDAATLEESIEKSYTALYRAKSMVGSHYRFYTKELDDEAHEFAKMKGALQKAVQNNEFVLHYQPKLNIKKGSVVGVEVLIRWLHPTLGLLLPDKFLDIAEDTGCIIALGDWALRESCKINKYWQNEGYEHLTVALNLSTKQFFHPNFLTTLTKVLDETKLDANYLALEVNEETIMSDLPKSTSIMKEVAALGVQISIDHFGIGYTSISHLKHLPINTIKIDSEFINGVPFNPNDSAITSAIIALAHCLGISVLATGVENPEQLQFLADQQCDMVQGYFLSYPLPADGVVQHFKKIIDRALS